MARSAQALGRSRVNRQEDFLWADGNAAHSASLSRLDVGISEEQMLPDPPKGFVKLGEMVGFLCVEVESVPA